MAVGEEWPITFNSLLVSFNNFNIKSAVATVTLVSLGKDCPSNDLYIVHDQ